jgi:hypothetical protein
VARGQKQKLTATSTPNGLTCRLLAGLDVGNTTQSSAIDGAIQGEST